MANNGTGGDYLERSGFGRWPIERLRKIRQWMDEGVKLSRREAFGWREERDGEEVLGSHL